MGELLLGKNIADEINAKTQQGLRIFKESFNINPTLIILTTGETNALKLSDIFLHENAAIKLGIQVRKIIISEHTNEAELIGLIEILNDESEIFGILTLLPLPDHIDQAKILANINPHKELEGLFENKNRNNLFEGKQINIISALFTICSRVNYDLEGNNILLIDDNILKNNFVVKKLIEQSQALDIKINIVKTSMNDCFRITAKADLLMFSLIEPESIDHTFVKPGAILIDFNPIAIGETYSQEKQRNIPLIKSCLQLDSVLTKASFVAPVLGGIGPIALANLMKNFLFNCNAAMLNTGKAGNVDAAPFSRQAKA